MFLETMEKLNSINKTLALSFGSLSTIVIFGLGLYFLWFIFFMYKSRGIPELKKINTKMVLLVLIVIVWLPVFIESTSANWSKIFKEVELVTATTEIKSENRLCIADKNSNLKGGACLMEPYIKEVKTLVPIGSKVVIISDAYYGLFLKYRFIADYQVTSRELADYWLFYGSRVAYQIDSNSELLEVTGDSKKNWGRFEVLKIIDQNRVILKKM
jgi:hypothetical protein